MPPDAQAADSSTAPSSAVEALAANDFAAYSELENAREIASATGKEPPATEKPAAESVTAPVVQETKPAKNAETRKAELKAEIDELLKKRAELQGKTEAPGEKKADPPPAAVETKPDTKDKAPVKPLLKDFETWQLYDEAKDKYDADILVLRVNEALAANAKQIKVATANKAIEDGLTASKAEAREMFDDFDAVALAPNTPISKATDGWILKHSKPGGFGMHVLYRLGEHDGAEAKRIFALDAYDQVEELNAICAEFKGSIKAPPVKKVTTAPAPATDLGARNTEPADKVRAALAGGDFAKYEREANAADVRAKRG